MQSFDAFSIIGKKNKGLSLTQAEFSHIVHAYLTNKISDFQIAAFLMSSFHKGISEEETYFLTRAMSEEGERLDLSRVKKPVIDKHATGGVGDGTTLVLAPLVASMGIAMPTMAGRSLGLTGGTIDKLESIPGFRTDLSSRRIEKQIKSIGCAVFAQTEKLACADRKFYAIRDQINCVASNGLIVSRILSKKIVEDIDALVLDLKVGSGAFIKTDKEAARFASLFTNTARRLGLKVTVCITDMDQPLGKNIGNSLEIEQAVDLLSGKKDQRYEDIRVLIIELASEMLLLSSKKWSKEKALSAAGEMLDSKKPLEIFKKMVRAQNGDAEIKLPQARHKLEINSPKSGYVSFVNAQKIAQAQMVLGGLRAGIGSKIDLSCGIILNKKQGMPVENIEPLGWLAHNLDKKSKKLVEAKEIFLSAFSFSKTKPRIKPALKEIIYL